MLFGLDGVETLLPIGRYDQLHPFVFQSLHIIQRGVAHLQHDIPSSDKFVVLTPA